jgi:hypothetical protein
MKRRESAPFFVSVIVPAWDDAARLGAHLAVAALL